MLYTSDEREDLANVLAAIDGLAEGMGLELDIDQRQIDAILRGMRHDFPAQGGENNASAFKKAANFLCYFVANKPVLNPFPVAKVGDLVSRIPNHQNAIVGWHIAIDALHNAKIHRQDCEIALENRISLSRHSYVDVIEAVSTATPSSHFHLVSVLLEQMCYRVNPDASYPSVI